MAAEEQRHQPASDRTVLGEQLKIIAVGVDGVALDLRATKVATQVEVRATAGADDWRDAELVERGLPVIDADIPLALELLREHGEPPFQEIAPAHESGGDGTGQNEGYQS